MVKLSEFEGYEEAAKFKGNKAAAVFPRSDYRNRNNVVRRTVLSFAQPVGIHNLDSDRNALDINESDK